MSSPVVSYPIALKDTPTVYRGTEFDWTLQMGDDGATVDLTAYGTTWAATLRAEIRDNRPVDFAVDITHLTDGYIVLSLTGDQTAHMTQADLYGFDVIASGGTTSPFPVWSGSVVVDGSWTLHA